MRKRVLCLWLSLCALLCLLPVGARGIGERETGEEGFIKLERSTLTENDSPEAQDAGGVPEAAYVSGGALAYGSLADAIANVDAGGDVIVLRDVELETGLNVTKSMRLYSNGDDQYKITYTAKDRRDCLLTVKGGVSVILAYLTLDGGREEGREAHAELVELSGSQLILRDEAVLQNNDNVDASEGAGGLRILNGGQAQLWPNSCIRNCRGTLGGGVAVVGNNVRPPSSTGNYHLIMLGGVIENCQAIEGGGVYIEQQGAMFMAQGDSPIRGNRAEMDPDDPDSRTAGCGGGVFLEVGYVQMGSGSIKDNHAENSGGGVFVEAGNFIQGGGIVTGNYAEKYGGGVFVSPLVTGTTVTLGGSPNVTGNTSGNQYFYNIYLDNDEEYPTDVTHPITMGSNLGPTSSVGVSRWLRPDKDHPYRVVAVPGKNVTITDGDLEKFHSDDPKYIVLLKEGNIVLTTAKVLFDSQGHGPEVPGQELGPDHLVHEPDETRMTERGYTFEGWYTEPECETPWQFDSEITEDENDERRPILTLYAKWAPIPYRIDYDMNDDDGGETNAVNGAGNPDGYNIESETITLEAPRREGYTFLGWTWEEETEPQMEVEIPQGSVDDKSFTANWEKEDPPAPPAPPKPPDRPRPPINNDDDDDDGDDDPPVRPTPKPTATPKHTATPKPSATPSPAPSAAPSAAPTAAPSAAPAPTAAAAADAEPSPLPTSSPAPDVEPSPTPEPAPLSTPAAGPTVPPEPVPTPAPDPVPKTGDPTHTAVWAGCALAALAGLVLVLRPRRKRR